MASRATSGREPVTGLFRTFVSEWHAFRADAVGHRFRNHERRLQDGPMIVRVTSFVLGVLLVVVGIIFCFIPGPGVPVIVFGLALLAGESKVLAGWLDRAEPPIRRRARGVGRWWKHLRPIARVALVAAGATVGAGLSYAAWGVWLA